jgi:hypothetical protein
MIVLWRAATAKKEITGHAITGQHCPGHNISVRNPDRSQDEPVLKGYPKPQIAPSFAPCLLEPICLYTASRIPCQSQITRNDHLTLGSSTGTPLLCDES